MDLKDVKINFLGDSITEGYKASSVEKTYWSVLGKETGAICRGYGISGTRIAPQRYFKDNIDSLDFIKRVDDMDADAGLVVVFGGTNDFGHGDAAFGTMSDRTPDSFYGAMHTLCQKLLNKFPDSQLMFMTPTHRCNENCLYNSRGFRAVSNLAGYVDAIKEVCRFYSIPVLDLYSVSGINPELSVMKDKYMPDGLHPNDAGHELIKNKLIGFIKAL